MYWWALQTTGSRCDSGGGENYNSYDDDNDASGTTTAQSHPLTATSTACTARADFFFRSFFAWSLC